METKNNNANSRYGDQFHFWLLKLEKVAKQRGYNFEKYEISYMQYEYYYEGLSRKSCYDKIINLIGESPFSQIDKVKRCLSKLNELINE